MQHQYLDPHILAHLPKNVELIAKRLVQGMFVGYHRSPFFGTSVEFADHRQYYPGDELRTMDWRVWAKHDRYCIKRFMMESQLKATILLDCSTSMDFRSNGLSKLEYGCYLAASLSYLIIHQNDMAGLVSFDDTIRDYLPPRGSRAHMRSILHALERLKTGPQTNVARICHHLAETMRARGMIILISDLLDTDYTRPLRVLSQRHDLTAITLSDPRESELPDVGFIQLRDAETGHQVLVDTSDARLREQFAGNQRAAAEARSEGLRRLGVDEIRIDTTRSYIEPLVRHFRSRARRH